MFLNKKWLNKRHINYKKVCFKDEREIQTIRGVLNRIEQNTCLRFQRHHSDSPMLDFIAFERSKAGDVQGCYTLVGKCISPIGNLCVRERKGGYKSVIVMDPGCSDEAMTFHLLLHKLGLWHEHSRFDRNKYIKILTENIKEGKFCGNNCLRD